MNWHLHQLHHQGNHHQATAETKQSGGHACDHAGGCQTRQLQAGGIDGSLRRRGAKAQGQSSVHQRLHCEQHPAMQHKPHLAEQACTEACPQHNRQAPAPGKAAVSQVGPCATQGGGHDRQGASGQGLVWIKSG